MRRFARRHPTAALLAACYGLGLALLLVWHLGGFVYNRVLHANGTLQTVELTGADFDTNGDLYRLEDGRYATVGADPQLLALDTALRADSILLEMETTREPGMVSAYWAKTPGADHSVRRMAYAEKTGANTWLVTLPVGGGVNLRIDPDIAEDNVLTITRIVLNPKRGFGSFFVPSAGEWFLLAAGPGLAACAVKAALEWRAKRRGAAL